MEAGLDDDRAAVLDLEPLLGVGLSQPQFARARRHVTAPLVALPRGAWSPVAWQTKAVRLLVVEGMLLRTTEVGGVSAHELLARGDVLGRADLLERRHQLHPGPALLHPVFGWQAMTPVTIAVIDLEFIRLARPWPVVFSEISRRAVARVQRLALLYAIGQVRNAEQRIHLALVLLAESWGRPQGDAVVLELRLTHATLGRLVGADRSTVTQALKRLRAAGTVEVGDDGLMVVAVPRGR